MNKKTIDRVQKMEERFESLQRAVGALEGALAECQDFKQDYKALCKYLDSGKWLQDYEADEQGRLPAGLKRGVLSQDALYNLLQDASDVMAALKDIR